MCMKSNIRLLNKISVDLIQDHFFVGGIFVEIFQLELVCCETTLIQVFVSGFRTEKLVTLTQHLYKWWEDIIRHTLFLQHFNSFLNSISDIL